ncbi:hypothetical protein BJY00DRAFT_281883 [Aspergillus carlsbadensis]|nr:hypothetical protein BJY00DRAFT_281883 [Aspergillus carlsbadensis]
MSVSGWQQLPSPKSVLRVFSSLFHLTICGSHIQRFPDTSFTTPKSRSRPHFARPLIMSSRMAPDKKSRIVKLRNNNGSYKLDLNSWRRHSMDTLFDDVYDQQNAYLDELDMLEDDLKAAEKRECKLGVQQESRDAKLQAKIAALERSAEGLRAATWDLKTDLAIRQQQLEAAKSRVSELEIQIAADKKANSRSDAAAVDMGKDRSTHASGSTFIIPDPPKLGGKVQIKFLSWKYLLQRKLAACDGTPIATTSSLDYVINQTSGEAQEQLIARLRSVVLKPITNANEALEFLDFLYNDPELETRDPPDFRPPDQPRDGYWAAFSDFVWNAVKYKIPEDEWGPKLHEYMQVQFGDDIIGDFSTYSAGPLKELAKEIYWNVLRLTQ